ncbi:hypothetical protein [Acinetobacter bereziniae]|uniref:hypothetical protein n=1 Tax=Acinetobacter bereziniae TaxID=106648 RepID=UPI0012504A0A|nr:hypothetical protein [Acinetobacter bereziniae]
MINNNILLLIKESRKAYDKYSEIIEYDLGTGSILSRTKIALGEMEVHGLRGFYYEFYDWSKNRKKAILYYKNNVLYLLYGNNEFKVSEVEVNKILFWKKIIINKNVLIKVFSPFYTFFLITDQYPDAVEPIYDKFLYLSEKNAIYEEIKFLKNKE